MIRIRRLTADDSECNLDVFEKYTGMRCSDILNDLSIPFDNCSKNFLRIFVNKMLDTQSINFDASRYTIKTIRTVNNEKVKESMSLRVVDYCSMVCQNWDDSDFKKELSAPFLFLYLMEHLQLTPLYSEELFQFLLR